MMVSFQRLNHFKRKEKIFGQYWTPPEVADFIVSYCSRFIDSNNYLACDPTCGDGVFLESLIKYGFEPYGIDIDPSVTELADAHVKKYIHIQDALFYDEYDKFDLVVGNPPFSSKYGRIKKKEVLERFELGKNRQSQAIEILFLEQFVRLCKSGGVIGIILPFGIFSDLRLKFVRDYIRRNLSVIAIISLPRNIFNGPEEKTSAKTCILIGKKIPKQEEKIEKVMFSIVHSLDELKSQSLNFVLATPSEFLYPEFYIGKDDSLDALPRLKDYKVQIIQGKAKYGSQREFSESGIRFISAKNITDLGIDFSKDEKFIKPGGVMDNKKAYVEKGDVLFVRVGVGCIGRVAVVTLNIKAIVDDWIYILRIKDKRLSPFYLALWLQTPVIKKEILRLARGVGTITIPISMVKELPIPCPSRDILVYSEKIYNQTLKEKQKGNFEKARQILKEALYYLEKELL